MTFQLFKEKYVILGNEHEESHKDKYVSQEIQGDYIYETIRSFQAQWDSWNFCWTQQALEIHRTNEIFCLEQLAKE